MRTTLQTVIVVIVSIAILVGGVLSADMPDRSPDVSIQPDVTAMQPVGATPVDPDPTEEPTEEPTATVVPTEEPGTPAWIERLVDEIIAIIREILESLVTPTPVG